MLPAPPVPPVPTSGTQRPRELQVEPSPQPSVAVHWAEQTPFKQNVPSSHSESLPLGQSSSQPGGGFVNDEQSATVPPVPPVPPPPKGGPSEPLPLRSPAQRQAPEVASSFPAAAA